MNSIQISPFTFENKAITQVDFKVLAKRYTKGSLDGSEPVVVFMHCTGSHKETWEPTIDSLLALDSRIEAWVVDAPNHGEASLVNDAVNSSHVLSIEDYSKVVLVLLQSGTIPNLQQRPLIIVGHSAGGSSAALLISLANHPNTRLILIEPVPELFTPDPDALQTHSGMVFHDMTKAKRDVWANRQSAQEWFAKRLVWQLWDPRTFELFMTYGLRDLPTAVIPDKQGVTLSCTKADELWIYSPEGFSLFKDCVRSFQAAIPRARIHVIFAENTIFKLEPTDPIYENIKKLGCTIDTIEEAGHLVVQEAPAALANVLRQYIALPESFQALESKL